MVSPKDDRALADEPATPNRCLAAEAEERFEVLADPSDAVPGRP